MLPLYKKELNAFFSSIVGYISIAVFLVCTWLVCWFLPSENNIFDFGFTTLDSFFYWAPIVYFFLVPALTMRCFSEEYRMGTIEILYTKPLQDWDIIIAKFLAHWTLLLIALLPTLVYFYAVYQLASPIGNMDTGATVGSYIGLWFVGGAYVAIGVFASSLSSNQIVSFIIAFFLCICMYYAFDSAGQLPFINFTLANILPQIGMYAHYQSISRGVIDTRDLLYFVSIIFLFLFLTHFVLQKRKW